LPPTEELVFNAAAGQPAATVEALSAAGRERREDSVARTNGLHFSPNLEDAADKLMPHHGARVQPLLSTEIGMQVRATQTRKIDCDNCITRRLQPRIGQLNPLDLLDSLESNSPHRSTPLVRLTETSDFFYSGETARFD
jgi:hypothetical protein